jgi:beta-fructofuranosidase
LTVSSLFATPEPLDFQWRFKLLYLRDKWIWDSWYIQDEEMVWHVFFLQADKTLGDPEQRHWNVSHGHATSRDLSHWMYHGTVFGPSDEPAFDDFTTWTGCVIRTAETWTMFYTGTSRAEDGLVQRIGRATSPDLSTWTREGLALDFNCPGAEHYEGHVPGRWKDSSLRDPWVISDPDGSGWLMFFTSRSPLPDETNASGAVGLARSPDLVDWTLHPPVYIGTAGELEVPQVFEREGRWYCLFCTTAHYWSDAMRAAHLPTNGTHYLVADHPIGPWSLGPMPFLDGTPDCDRYAGRILRHHDRDLFIAFNKGSPECFAGTLCDPIAVTVHPDGILSLQGLPE